MLAFVSILWLLPSAAQAESYRELPAKAKEILTKYCHKCHGQNGTRNGGIDYMIDLRKLRDREKVVPGDAAASKIIQMIESEDEPMPPFLDDAGNINEVPSQVEIDFLKAWINEGADDVEDIPSTLITDQDLFNLILGDLRSVRRSNPESLPFIRYISQSHLANSGIGKERRGELEDSLSQMINSLSWGHAKRPAPVGVEKILYRIDLRDYLWTQAKWDLLASAYPYRYNISREVASAVTESVTSAVPVIRSDWFGSNASRPPFYHQLLDMPSTDLGLERVLGVDVANNIRVGEVTGQGIDRSGFNDSGVSFNNRMIERHVSSIGSYWKSYDFRAGGIGKNLFEFPLGPGGEHNFRQDGGEIIFALPNGLQAYLLVNASGSRIDIAPADVVSDPASPEGIINGISCMGCHVDGIKNRSDQVKRAVLNAPAGTFDPSDIAKVEHIYSSAERLGAVVQIDADRFLAGIRQASFSNNPKAVLTSLSLDYARDLDLSRAAAELGIPAEELLLKISGFTPNLRRIVSSLERGTIKRRVFEDNIAALHGETFGDSGKLQARVPYFFWKSGTANEERSGVIASDISRQCIRKELELKEKFGSIGTVELQCGRIEKIFGSPSDNDVILGMESVAIFSSQEKELTITKGEDIVGAYATRNGDPLTGFDMATALSNWSRRCSQVENAEPFAGVLQIVTCGSAPINAGNPAIGTVKFISKSLRVAVN
jgi:hypothetical protein